MKKQTPKKQLHVRTQVQGGAMPWWGMQCLDDHYRDRTECCVSGTPTNCSQCIKDCINNQHLWNYEWWRCIGSKGCLG